MYSDDSEHSESEFYYPEEADIPTTSALKTKNVAVNSDTTQKTCSSNSDIQQYIESQRPENTKKKTEYDLNVLTRYFQSVNEFREIENVPANELNTLLARFFVNIRKRNGDVYEPSSLTAFQRSLQRYLNDKNSTINVFQDQAFANYQEA